MRAEWNGVIVADSSNTIMYDGKFFFPMESLNKEYLKVSDKKSSHPKTGKSVFYHLKVKGQINEDCVCLFMVPTPETQKVKNHVYFLNGVNVIR
jgi:uncharacterized protein (DUF427 family)